MKQNDIQWKSCTNSDYTIPEKILSVRKSRERDVTGLQTLCPSRADMYWRIDDSGNNATIFFSVTLGWVAITSLREKSYPESQTKICT